MRAVLVSSRTLDVYFGCIQTLLDVEIIDYFLDIHS